MRNYLLKIVAFILILSGVAWAAGSWSTNQFSYKPQLTTQGTTDYTAFNTSQDRVDARLAREVWVGDTNVSGYATFAAAVATLNSAGTNCILRLPSGTHSVAADLTVNSNILLAPEYGALIAIATTKTLTINGSIEAGLYQIFSCTGTGKVVLGGRAVKEVYPEWWAVNTSPGTTDMTAAVQAALIAGEGASLYLANTYLIGSDMTIPGAIRIYGPGKLIAAEWVFPTVGQPPVDITATGTLGAGVAYGSAIAIGETSFTVANSFEAGDLLLLSNLPAAQADRRNELLIVSTATGAGFTTTTGVLQTYADTTTLQFQKVTPVEGIHFDSVNIENINLMFTLCRNYSVTNSRVRKGFVSSNRCSDFVLDFKNFDAEYSGCLVDIQGMSRNFRVTGNLSGGVGVSGNALIKTNGAAYYSVDANINGSVNGGGTMSSFLADSLYTDNPTGYDYQTNCYFSARINSQNLAGVAAELGWVNTMPADTQPHDFYLDGQWGANGAVIKGKDGVVAGISKGGYLALAYTSGIIVSNDAYAGITFTGTNTGVQGLWVPWTPTITGSTGTAPEPTMSAVTKGRYRQIGKTIEVRAIYDWTDAGSRTGLLRLNLPFVAESTANLQAPLSLGYSTGLEAGKSMRAVVQQGTSTARIYYDESSQQTLTATGTLTMSGIYEIGY